MGDKEPDFTGWATAYNQKCTDGRTIKPGAFAHMTGQRVPLVWMHQHNGPENILGHAILYDRAFGTYTEGFFNGTRKAQDLKIAVQHGDVTTLSIFANGLQERRIGDGKEVYHGDIKELSLVVAGANPGAVIDNVNIIHGDHFEVVDSEAIIHTGLELSLTPIENKESDRMSDDVIKHADEEKTVKDILGTLSEEQQNAVTAVVAEAFEAGKEEAAEGADVAHGDNLTKDEFLAHVDNKIKEGFDNMTNVFDREKVAEKAQGLTLSHADQASILSDARESGKTLKKLVREGGILESDVIKHAAEAGTYGVDDIELLFPDFKNLDNAPQFIKRKTEWVDKVLSGVTKRPFAKIKTLLADITADEARARGYVKGTEKKEEIISLLKRTTSPTTIYKKQRLDRDDIIDITDFDIVAWLKVEIRMMLDEEIARAILVGDGRSVGHPDKIKDPAGQIDGVGVRSILHEHEMYAAKIELAANVDALAKTEAITRARSVYRGSGNPTFFTTDPEITDMLLQKDKVNRRLYATETELASVLRVKEIVPVEVMEEHSNVLGIIVNLTDYTVGANRGGEISFFDDFDIDFNQEIYLMETRISGALTKPKSAVVLLRDEGTEVTPAVPAFNGTTNTITVPTTTGVIYTIDDEPVTGSVVIEEDTQVIAKADEGYYIPSGTTKTWSYSYTAG